MGPAIDDDCLQSGQYPGQGLSAASIRLDGEDAGCTQHTFGIFACPNTLTMVLEKRPNPRSAPGLYAAGPGVGAAVEEPGAARSFLSVHMERSGLHMLCI